MGKLSKTAKASGATGVVKKSGPSRVEQKYQTRRRAHKNGPCAVCKRQMRQRCGSVYCHLHKEQPK